MDSQDSQRKLLPEVQRMFEHIVRDVASHCNVDNDSVYPQPHTYLTSHLICMKAASWEDVDFDALAALSGASALFAYEPGTFEPKYALLHIDIDKRIADATGFGWEWIEFESPEAAWEILKDTIDEGHPLKGLVGESAVFAGYENTGMIEDRRVFALTDGGEYFVDWWSWREYSTWAEHWSDGRLGRHTGSVATLSTEEVALRVLRDLVSWAHKAPYDVERKFPKATFGLAGVSAYADDCADTETFPDWHACHDINPQWTVRNSTAVYLDRMVTAGDLPTEMNAFLSLASEQYRNAYQEWRRFYRLLGHGAERTAGKSREIREKGAEHVRNAFDHETVAIGELNKALQIVNRA